MPPKPYVWTSEALVKLRSLASEGMFASDMAGHMSAELGRFISEASIYQQCSKWNIPIFGRFSGQITQNTDPFAKPSWMDKVIEKQEETSREFAYCAFLLIDENGNRQPDKTDEELLHGMWVRYLLDYGLASEKEAEKVSVRDWFRRAAPVYSLRTWRPSYDGQSSAAEPPSSQVRPDVVNPGGDGVTEPDTGGVMVGTEVLVHSKAVITPKLEDEMLEPLPDEEEEPVVDEGWAAMSRPRSAKAFRRR